MATNDRPDQANKSSENAGSPQRDDDLERRRRDLDAVLAKRRPAAQSGGDNPRSRDMAGFGKALRLSSEFIAGILVGVGLGWVIDHWAGTSPWGLIICLFLGFGAGVLNVLRTAGLVAEAGIRAPDSSGGQPPKK